jgi:simple sugar transport system permease protein
MKRLFADAQFNFLLAVNVLVLAAATLLSHGEFVGLYNLQSMASQMPELGLLGLGVMLAMVSGNGGIDLSGIALANLAAMVAVLLAPHLADAGQAPVRFVLLFAAIALAVGLVGGMLNGLLIARFGLTPILCTLGTQLLFTGIAVVLSNGSALRLDYVELMDSIGNDSVLGVPYDFAAFVVIALLLGALLRLSPFGIRLFLIGTNARAARYAGIAEGRMLFATYTLCGVLASVAGFLIAARTSAAKWDYGSSYVLIAILIAVMAGVRPQGGYGRVSCVVLSVMALQFLSSTFNFLGLSNYFRDCAWGLLLLLFLASSRFSLGSFFPRRARLDASTP